MSHDLPEFGPPIRSEMIQCVTDQWNFPHPREQPWVDSDGMCSICGGLVEFVTLGPDKLSQYTRIAQPHLRVREWYEVSSDRLSELLQYEEWF